MKKARRINTSLLPVGIAGGGGGFCTRMSLPPVGITGRGGVGSALGSECIGLV